MTPAKTLYLETMGCQMNALDSELVLGDLLAQGYRLVEDPAEARLVIINTCSVRQHAEDKVYSRLGQLGGRGSGVRGRGTGAGGQSSVRRPRRSDQIVAVIGCMPERDGDGLLAKAPNVDILCGPSQLHRLSALIADVEERRKPAIALSRRLRQRSTEVRHDSPRADLESLDAGREFGPAAHASTPKVFGRRQAYVRITRGCNKHCTFCVVPHTRGPEKHRSPDRIVEEVCRMADNGVVEVTLLGQTVNHYHYRDVDGNGETTFATLLRRVHDKVPRLPRLRFVTSYPRDFSDEALEVMASAPRICRYLHIPVQSGSDSVLQRMNRGHTVEQYIALLDRARALMPDISIAGDMIVGFSGESEQDFEQSLELLRYAKYKNCFVFKYSPRPGTLADDRLPDDVPDEVKKRRNAEMLAVQAEVSLAAHREMLDQVVEVLVEGPSKKAIKLRGSQPSQGKDDGPAGGQPDQLVGRTRGDQIVLFDGRRDMIGRFAQVRITEATPHTLHGAVALSPREAVALSPGGAVALSPGGEAALSPGGATVSSRGRKPPG